MRKGIALVVGATGITGSNLTTRLLAEGWTVYGLSRNPAPGSEALPVAADLLDAEATRQALAGLPITHLFFCTWTRRDSERENIAANGAMMRHLFAALETAPLEHASLVTGTKQYLGAFESYGSGRVETPFRENEPRLPGENFYYTLEDILFEHAERRGFGWTVHRPHTVIGHARGNLMNMGSTLAVYASLCKASGEPFVFPGSTLQWNALTDITDATLLAEQMSWAAQSPAARGQAFNATNGDIFRWRWMWAQIAAYFGVEPVAPPAEGAPLESRMQGAEEQWRALAEAHGLAEPELARLASWWHSDADLGRELECVNDMTKSRDHGFTAHRDSRASFLDLFDRLRAERLIP